MKPNKKPKLLNLKVGTIYRLKQKLDKTSYLAEVISHEIHNAFTHSYGIRVLSKRTNKKYLVYVWDNTWANTDNIFALGHNDIKSCHLANAKEIRSLR